MISVRTYGHSGLTSSAYYHFGITNNFAKFGLPGAIVEAGWLEGRQANFGAPVSNLPKRPVDAYNVVTNPNRFGSLVLITAIVVPLFSKRAMVLPGTLNWVLYS